MLSILEQRNIPIGDVFALASARSVGTRIRFRNRTLKTALLDDFDFGQTQIALFSAGASVSAQHAPRAVKAGCIVIDNTSQFRYAEDVPLVVPEVNPLALSGHHGIIANPNCSTIQMVVALKPIYDAVGIERINVCTYQAVSGAGRQAIEELASQTAALLNGKPATGEFFPKRIAFNALPHIDVFLDNGYTREEMKIVWETRKIFADDGLRINVTAVRIPVFYGHSEAVHIETRDKIDAQAARSLLRNAPGVELLDEARAGGYPTAATDAADHDAVFVGRVRDDISHERGLNLWIVSDNLRKGAALNSVQIAEALIANGL
jgi:aspartate-semialdehyde dehydrogenase